MDSYYTVFFVSEEDDGDEEHLRRFNDLTSAEALYHKVINKPWCKHAMITWGSSLVNNYWRPDNETDDRK